jgi:hypothetical protein
VSYGAITKPTQGDATKKSLIDAIIDDLDDLNARLLAVGTISGLKNGSFESDSDSDGTPDSWTKTLYSSGSFTLDGSDQQHSAKSAKFTSPGGGGNGGGYLETTDFLEVSPLIIYTLNWEMKSSVAGVNNKVEVTYYTAAQASISTTALYDSSANPTAWTPKTADFRPSSTARFAKIRVTGCHTSSTTAGSTWFDNLWIAGAQFKYKQKVTFTASGTWTCPSGITQARITSIGAGGGGGSTGSGGGGGGGGSARSATVVTPTTGYTVTIGAAGAINGAGGNSVCNGVTGNGGGAGASGGSGGAGGSGTGDEVFAGTAGDAGPGNGGWAVIEGGPANEGVGGATNTAAPKGGKVIIEY